MVVREDEWSPLMREGESGGAGVHRFTKEKGRKKEDEGLPEILDSA